MRRGRRRTDITRLGDTKSRRKEGRKEGTNEEITRSKNWGKISSKTRSMTMTRIRSKSMSMSMSKKRNRCRGIDRDN